jgi:lipopolysaccharide transport system permease protein
MLDLARQAWRFRGFIVASVRREFASRYLGTQLGWLWPFVHPLALVLIYTLVFSEVMGARLPGSEGKYAYSIYLTSGLVLWMLFSELLGRSVGTFVHNAELLKKVTLPKITLPVIAAISSLVSSGFLLAAFTAFLVATGAMPGLPLLALLPVLGIAVLLAIALGTFLATVNVFYRDVEQTTSLVLQFWFWLTPIVYPVTALPEAARWVLSLNPLYPLTRAMQDIFLYQRFPDWISLAYPLGCAVVLALLARLTFLRLANELVDEL